jgi:hypothetical protein
MSLCCFVSVLVSFSVGDSLTLSQRAVSGRKNAKLSRDQKRITERILVSMCKQGVLKPQRAALIATSEEFVAAASGCTSEEKLRSLIDQRVERHIDKPKSSYRRLLRHCCELELQKTMFADLLLEQEEELKALRNDNLQLVALQEEVIQLRTVAEQAKSKERH